MSNFELMEELDEINKKYDHKDDFLGVDILTLTNKVDSVRGSMLSNMLQQAVCIQNSEPPRVFMRYENQVGQFSSSYWMNDDTIYANTEYTEDHENINTQKIQNPKKIVAIIPKFENSNNYYIIILKDMKTKEYSYVERKIAEKLTESYCYLYDNTVIDSKSVGDIIEPAETLYHSTNFDDEMNYSYGMNIPACYMIDNDTVEDAVKISDVLAEVMADHYMHEVEININTNDLLVNLYGDKDKQNYKCFPDIGEETLGKVLTARRRINYDNALFDLKDSQLMSINYSSDKIFYARGTVVDIEIFCNADIDFLKENKYNEQIIYYLEMQEKFYKKIYDVIDKIKRKGGKCTDDLLYLYRRAKDICNPEVHWRNDKTDFDHIVLRFKVLEKQPLHIGSKLAGRFGMYKTLFYLYLIKI